MRKDWRPVGSWGEPGEIRRDMDCGVECGRGRAGRGINREPFASTGRQFTRSKIGRKIGRNGGTVNMSLRGVLAELRQRNVLKVATVYLASGVVVLEGGSQLLHNFEAPHWVLKVFSALVIFGFPIACMMAWGFEFKDGSVRPAAAINPDAPAKPGRADAFLAGLLLLVLGLLAVLVVQQWRTQPASTTVVPATVAAAQTQPAAAERPATNQAASSQTAADPRVPPIVVIMDTAAAHGVYERSTRNKSGTNADDLNEVLRHLPVVIHKETIGATWDREVQILKQDPSLILIHRSAFFHSMNQELGFGYPGESANFDEARFRQLYEIADNKVAALLGFIGQENPTTVFLVYSRGTGGGWSEDQYRADWGRALEGRFPSLKGRVTTINVPGGPDGGSFHDEETRQLFLQHVQKLLGLTKGGG